MTLHKMMPIELQELKVQIRELLGKGFIKPSTSVRGTPALFIRKEVNSRGTTCVRRHSRKLKRRLNSAPVLIVLER